MVAESLKKLFKLLSDNCLKYNWQKLDPGKMDSVLRAVLLCCIDGSSGITSSINRLEGEQGKVIDREKFSEYFNLPVALGDRLFDAFDKKQVSRET